jgi:hypothetical protein
MEEVLAWHRQTSTLVSSLRHSNDLALAKTSYPLMTIMGQSDRD